MIKNSFIIGLKCKKAISPEDIDYSEYEFDEEYDSVTSVFYSLSESFYERGIELLLKICDHDCINFGVELSILFEEFHNFVNFVNNNSENEYALHFYEQGANRLLSFKKNEKGEYSLIFEDHSIVGFERLNASGTVLDLNLMLFTLFSKVRFLADKLCPSITKASMYSVWVDKIEGVFKL